MRIMPGGALEVDQELGGHSSVFLGAKLDEHRGAFVLDYPMEKGAVTEGGWDAMERLWEVGRFVSGYCRIFYSGSETHTPPVLERSIAACLF